MCIYIYTHVCVYIYIICTCVYKHIYIYSLSPTSRQAPENIKATKEILQIQNLLWDFQGFQGFNLASSPIIFKRHKVKLTPANSLLMQRESFKKSKKYEQKYKN